MGKNKKPFINKKKAQTFSLVHRSQRDPLQADDDAGQMVLVPEDGSSAAGTEQPGAYGIDYADEYDYEQHLRVRGDGELILADDPTPGGHAYTQEDKPDDRIRFGDLFLPPEALPSAYEEEEGMLAKGVLPRGPQPDWDPDIVEALDDGIDLDDPENLLDDDFMMLANGEDMQQMQAGKKKGQPSKMTPGDEFDMEADGWESCSDSDADSSGEEFSGVDSDFDLNPSDLEDADDDNKTRFTNYSMTSSVIRRTEELKLLDDRFEKIMEEYDEGEIGCCDHEDLQGRLLQDSDLFKHAVGEMEKNAKLHELGELAEEGTEEEIEIDENAQSSEEEGDEQIFAQFKETPKPDFDCESIVSTYSNLYNHPKLIGNEPNSKKQNIKINKLGLPEGVLNKKKQNTEAEADSEEMIQDINLNNNRSKDETSEEKRLRKKAVKELKRDRRGEKKANQLAFKIEQEKQERVSDQKIAQQQVIKL